MYVFLKETFPKQKNVSAKIRKLTSEKWLVIWVKNFQRIRVQETFRKELWRSYNRPEIREHRLT